MDRTLTGFVRALRAAGAQASPAETIDAARVLGLIGYADRGLLKSALSIALAKSEADKAVHDQVFEQFFAAPALAEAQASAAAAHTGQHDLDRLLDLASGAADAHSGAPAGTALSLALARAAQAVGVDDIRFQTQTAYFSRRMLEQLGIAALEARLLQRLGEAAADASRRAAGGPLANSKNEAGGDAGANPPSLTHAQAEAQTLQAARDALQRQAAALAQQRFELYGRGATEAFMTDVLVHRPLGRLAPGDMQRMKAAVQRMAHRLATRYSQRRRQQWHGKLDMRRTLRANAGHDSVPFHLAWRFKRRDRPRIVAICDVSGSVAQNVRFLLLFLYALQGVVDDLRSFAFSNHLRDIGAALEQLPFDAAMAQVIDQVGGGATDYGQALVDLRDRHWPTIDHRTTVLVLGDGRSNHANPRLDIFAELAQRARRVVWLCPEPVGRWGSGDSCMLQYRPLCSHVSHCSTAADLERAIDDALQAYA